MATLPKGTALQKRFGMARHLTALPAYTHAESNHTCFCLPNFEPGPHLPTSEKWKAELT